MSILGKEPVKVVDARLGWEADKEVIVCDGASQLNFQTFQAQSNSTSNQTYQINVPSLQTGMSKLVFYHWTGRATFTCTNAVSVDPEDMITAGVAIGISENGPSQVISNESVQIGSKQNNILRSRCGVELGRINNPSRVDAMFKTGTGGYLKDYGTDFESWEGTNMDVLGQYYNVPKSDQVPTSRLTDAYVISETPTGCVIGFDILFTSEVAPFCQTSEGDTNAIRNLNNVIFNLNLESQLARLFSIKNTSQLVAQTQTISNIQLSNLVFDTCEMYVQFITPSPWSLKHYTPLNDVYAYNEVQTWTVNGPLITANNRAQFNTQQITGSVTPSFIIIGARPNQSLLALGGAEEPRLWFPVESTQLYYNNTQILNGASRRQLYDMSVKNGLTQVTYEQFIGRDVRYNSGDSYKLGGSFLVINPAKDCQIVQNADTNGCINNWSLTGSITVSNQTGVNYGDTELIIIAVYDGFLVSNGKVTATIGTLTKEQALNCFNSNEVPMTDIHYKMESGNGVLGYAGGSIKSFLKGLGKHAVNIGKTLYENRDKLADVYKAYKGRGYEGGAKLDISPSAVSTKRELSRAYMNK
jgi:hypothetical protein